MTLDARIDVEIESINDFRDIVALRLPTRLSLVDHGRRHWLPPVFGRLDKFCSFIVDGTTFLE